MRESDLGVSAGRVEIAESSPRTAAYVASLRLIPRITLTKVLPSNYQNIAGGFVIPPASPSIRNGCRVATSSKRRRSSTSMLAYRLVMDLAVER
jgi:hypothetical protein